MEYYKKIKQTYSAAFSAKLFSVDRQYYTRYAYRFIFQEAL